MSILEIIVSGGCNLKKTLSIFLFVIFAPVMILTACRGEAAQESVNNAQAQVQAPSSSGDGVAGGGADTDPAPNADLGAMQNNTDPSEIITHDAAEGGNYNPVPSVDSAADSLVDFVPLLAQIGEDDSAGADLDPEPIPLEPVLSEPSAITYIGNINSLVFHLPTCYTLPYPQNRVPLESRQIALDRGFRACLNSKPSN